jgi:NAD(P)H-hydrate epimerase
MTIFSAAQIKEWDNYTIKHRPISSIDLMESAAFACLGWLRQNSLQSKHILIFCGKGNNGGDGLAIARLLLQENYKVTVFIPHIEKPGSADFELNLNRLYDITNEIHFINDESALPRIDKNDIIIDALFGTGLHDAVGGLYKIIIDHINEAITSVISIDLPSGLLTDNASSGSIVRANYTITFEQYKLALLMAKNEQYFGDVVVLQIGLSRDFAGDNYSPYVLITKATIAKIYKPLPKGIVQ